MSMIIRDPQNGQGARVVGVEGRLRTAAETLSIGAHETFVGHGYELLSGIINMTGTTESGLLYVRNTGIVDLVFDHLDVFLGVSDAGSLDSVVRVYRNPTAGTLISAGVTLVTAAINRNFGSANVPTATMLTGAVGLTVTASDGVNFLEILGPPATHSIDLDGIVLPPNASIAVTLVPPAGNGDMDVNVALQMYELTDAI